MGNKVYKITKDISKLGLKKGQLAKLSEETAEAYNLKEHAPKSKTKKTAQIDEQGVEDAN